MRPPRQPKGASARPTRTETVKPELVTTPDSDLQRPDRRPGTVPAMRPDTEPSTVPDPAESPHELSVEVPSSRRRGGRVFGASGNSDVVESDDVTGYVSRNEPIDMEQRRNERAEERRRVLRRRVRRGAGGLAGAAVVVYGVWFSPLFAYHVANTEVVGADSHVTEFQVKAALNSWARTPLARLHTDAMEDALRQMSPNVVDAQISRNFPRGVDVSLTLRQAVAAIDDAGMLTPIDATGTAMALSPEETAALPKLTKAEGDVHSAIDVMSALDDATRAQVASASVSKTDQVMLTLTNGAKVAWGGVERSDMKARVLKVLLSNVQAKNYDVSAPDSPVTY